MHGMTEIMKKTSEGVKPARLIEDGEEWLAGLIKKMRADPKGVHAEVCIITPDRARALLRRNPDNRKISELTVESYAQDLREGRFIFNGQPIVIANSGELNDGQHRCEAVNQTGINLECLVVAGVPRASRMTVDTGKVRTVGDFVGMHGMKDANAVAAVANLLLVIEHHGAGASGHQPVTNRLAKTTKSEVLSYAKMHLQEIEKALAQVPSVGSVKVCPRARLTAALILFARRSGDWEAAAQFIGSVIDGNNLHRDSPIYLARERLLREKQVHSLTPFKSFEILIRGWNYWRAGTRAPRFALVGSWPAIAV